MTSDQCSGNESSEYYFENGLRKVYPYHYTFRTYTKQRWLGRRLADVLSEEYRSTSPEGVMLRLRSGDVRVNGHPAGADHVLDHNELIEHRVHRHELPVLHSHIHVIYEDSELLVVDKPASLPIHPCGRFNKNSLSYLLERQLGAGRLHIIHRLDRMTSGVLLMSKTAERASAMSGLMRDRQMQKWYLAKVEGKFPDGVVECNEPLGPLSKKLGLQMVTPVASGGKESLSVFERLQYDPASGSSLVQCQPLTGRTHQLRVHLQHLGHPIVRDPLYNSTAWGPDRGAGGSYGGRSVEQLRAAMAELHSSEQFLMSFRHFDASASSAAPPEPKRRRQSTEETPAASVSTFDANRLVADPACDECRQRFRDPAHSELVLCLHAARYKGPGFDFCAPLPDWAAG